MGRNKKKEQVYRSNEEFERKFYPKFYKEKLEESMDNHQLAVKYADESLEKIRRRLVN